MSKAARIRISIFPTKKLTIEQSKLFTDGPKQLVTSAINKKLISLGDGFRVGPFSQQTQEDPSELLAELSDENRDVIIASEHLGLLRREVYFFHAGAMVESETHETMPQPDTQRIIRQSRENLKEDRKARAIQLEEQIRVLQEERKNLYK